MAKVVTSKLKICLVAIAVFCGALTAATGFAEANTPSPSALEIERSFDTAMAALDAGQPEAAIPILQGILATDPKLIRVRLELARAYFMAQQWARSREEFFRVLSGDLPEPVRKTVLSFIRQIDARRGFDWDLSIGLTTAGNNRNYDAEHPFPFGLGPDGEVIYVYSSRPVKQVPALRAEGSANFRYKLEALSGPKSTVLGYASLSASILEAEGRDYDDQLLRLRLGLRHLSQNTTLSFGPFVSGRRVRGEHYEDQYGLDAAFERRGLMGGSVYGRLSYAHVDSQFSSSLDGTLATAFVGFRRSVGGLTIVGGELNYERRRQDGLNGFGEGGYETLQLSAYSSFDIRNGWTIEPRVFVKHRLFLEVNPLYGEAPSSVSLGGALLVEKSDMFLPGGYTPYFMIDAERARSDIAAFSFRSVGVQIGVERRF